METSTHADHPLDARAGIVKSGEFASASSAPLSNVKKLNLEPRERGNPPKGNTSWGSELILNREGNPKAISANAIHALRLAPEWNGRLGFNSFSNETILRAPPPWLAGRDVWDERPWSDNDDRLLAEWYQHNGIMVGERDAASAAETVSREHEFHPVRDYLRSLRWDGIPRLDSLLSHYFGVDDDLYVRAVGSKWMISAVARVIQPGCKADCMLILEGPQGIRKSTGLAVLGGEWFSDRLSDLRSKDAFIELHGKWLVEFSELDTLGRSDSGTIKAFLSRANDRYRPPYGRRLIEVPRQCVFAGTVNPEGGYLKDSTGARRFWPVRCTTVDVESLREDRDQLWAEACQRYYAKDNWYLDTPELTALATKYQEARASDDPWLKPIIGYLRMGGGSMRDECTVHDILTEALCIEIGKCGQRDETRVARCLAALDYIKFRPRTGSGREYRYRRLPDDVN